MKNRKAAAPPPSESGLKKFCSDRKKVLLGVLFAAAALCVSQSHFILPLKADNGEFFITNYQVEREDNLHPRLQLLRKREHLDEVIRPGETQFDKIVLLRNWTRKQWEHGSGSFYYPPWDAVEILDLARNHGNRAFCAQYAIVFLQACLSVGLSARYVDLPGHFVTGVWSYDYDKWVVMDPYNDIHFEKDGVPMNGQELCEAARAENYSGIMKVGSGGVKTQAAKEDIDIYKEYSIDRRNNHLTRPITLADGKTQLTLNPDYHAYPVVGQSKITITDPFLAYKKSTSDGIVFKSRSGSDDPEDFQRDVNDTVFYYSRSKKDFALLKLALLIDDSPTFKTFQVSIDGGEWTDQPDRLMWELNPGVNKLSIRILTKFGWVGHTRSLTVFYKQPWLFYSEAYRRARQTRLKSV